MANQTQFSYRLSDGTIIPSEVNPDQAAIVDVAPVLTGQIASDVPPEILGRERQLQARGIRALPFNADASVTKAPYLGGVVEALDQHIQSLLNQGYRINPNAQITPQSAIDFMAQAAREIDPYYASQLKLARESFMRAIGYQEDQILRQEADLERKYGQGIRRLGESAAEQGFAQSGVRQEQEQNLSLDAQRQIDESRRRLGFETGNLARSFAQQYGTAQTNIPTISQAPRVLSGQPTFQRGDTAQTTPLYELSPDVYSGLVGTQQFEQETAKQRRASQLEQAARFQQTIPRTLSLGY